VIYPSGERSRMLYRNEANALRENFGGEVIFDERGLR
jgi:hypothetical protein